MKHSDAHASSGSSGQSSRQSPVQTPVQSVTSAPPSVADDQGTRMRRYLVAMSLRGVCFVLAIVTSGWLRWTFVVGAVVLPYVAVVLANAVGPRFGEAVAPVVPVRDEPPVLTGRVEDHDGQRLTGEPPREGGTARGAHDG